MKGVTMGLDYSINVKIKRRKDQEVVADFEIAYWRKCWALRTKTMQAAMANEENVISYNEDWQLEVKPEALEDIIKTLSAAVADRNDELFTDSIWDAHSVRQITIRQLSRLCTWDNLFARFDDILSCETIEERAEYLNYCYDIIRDIEDEGDFPSDLNNLYDVLMALEEYEFSIEIINSY